MYIRKNFLRLLFIALGAGFAITLTLSGCSKSKDSTSKTIRTLQIYCWSNYFNPEVIKAFEETAAAKVEFNYFSSNEEGYRLQTESLRVAFISSPFC